MQIYDRLKEVRASKDMNQADFAKSLGLGQSTLGMMEVGKRKISDRHIKTICSIYNIAERWFRTGEGDMYAPDAPADIFVTMREELNLSAIEEKILRGYFELDENSRKAVTDFIVNIGRSAATTPAAPDRAAERAEAHARLDQELDAEQEAAPASPDSDLDEKRA